MALQCVFGGDQAFRNQRLPVGEALAGHRHGNGDSVAERIVEGDADGADAKSVFFTIVRNTVRRAGLRSASNASRRVSVFGVRAS